jgi:hypothetical protein
LLPPPVIKVRPSRTLVWVKAALAVCATAARSKLPPSAETAAACEAVAKNFRRPRVTLFIGLYLNE